MTQYRIVLADDHVILRQGLRSILQGVGDLYVAGEADDGLQLLELLRREPVDLAVIDVSMPRLRGIEVIPEARAIQPDLRLLVLTMHRELALVRAALAAGAQGYLVKEDAPTQLFAAIETIRGGGVFVSPRLSQALAADPTRHGAPHACAGTLGLTLREREILRLVAAGNSSKDIASLLCISYRTVEHHRSSLRSKLGLRSTAELVKRALDDGFV